MEEIILACKNITKSYGVDCIIEDVSFIIEEGEKVAIVGVNGAGKTTLFKTITGEISFDSGEIITKKGSSLGYLSQMKDLVLENTIYEEMLSVFSDLIEKEDEIRELEKQMSKTTGEELEKIMEKYSRLNHEFEDQKGYEYKSRVRGVINGLGFSEAESSGPITHLSGGQKTRISLGKLLLTSPDLLLLDEPTNHLDIESVSWLEDTFLKSYQGAVLVISHDRYFLDKTVSKIIEIENRKAEVYNGTYSYYAYKKELQREQALKTYIDQQKEIKRQEDVIAKLKSYNREKSVKRAESREKMLSKMVKIEKPEDAPDKMRIILEPALTSGMDVLHLENVSKTFEEVSKPLFENISFDIKRGEIVALIGANGIGKTTLFKMIKDNLVLNDGVIKLGTNVIIGYYDQEYAILNEDSSIFDDIATAFPKLKNGEIRNALASFVFTGDEVFKKISTLSGGEKGRVSLVKLILSSSNFLLLDEPTNHLDMFSKEILEEALRNYTGTTMYISHDRYFINNTADKIIELTKDGVKTYLGNYDYYIEKKAEQKTLFQAKVQETETNNQNISKDKLDWKEAKEQQALERKRLGQIERIEKDIAKIEKKIAEADSELLKEEVFLDYEKSNEIFKQKTQLEVELEELYELWGELQI